MTERVEVRAMRLAKAFFVDQGFEVEDVASRRGHNGYDLVVARDAERLKVEVKGCSREWQIPDLYSTEVDHSGKLVADVLFVVYLLNDHEPTYCWIPRDGIPPEYFKPKAGFRISSKFKKRNVLEKYFVSGRADSGLAPFRRT